MFSDHGTDHPHSHYPLQGLRLLQPGMLVAEELLEPCVDGAASARAIASLDSGIGSNFLDDAIGETSSAFLPAANTPRRP